MSLALIASAVPRTIYQILTVPDMAVSWKWGVMMPSDIPEPYKSYQPEQPAQEEGGSGLWNTIKNVASMVKTAAGEIANQVSVTGICMRAESINVPLESITSTTTRTQARSRNFPDQINAESVSITFYEDYNYSTLSYLEKWKKSIVNEYGVFRLPSGMNGYARNIYAYLFDTVGLPKGTVVFEDCYPEQISPINYNSSSEAIKITCSFAVTRINWIPNELFNLGGAGAIGKTVLQSVKSGNLGNTGKSTISGIKSLF